MNDKFSEEYQATIGLDFFPKENVKISEQDTRLLLYEISSQEKGKSLIPIYTRDANIILLVYDVTSKDSFIHLSNWLESLTNVNKEEVIFAVVGNKTDLNDRRVVNSEDGENYAKEHDFIFAEVSAKTGDGIEKLFDVILKEMLKKKSGYQPQPILPLLQNIKEQGFGGKIKPEVEEKNCCECCC